MSQAGALVGRIPWDMIDRYADHMGLNCDNKLVFNRMMRSMDSIYLEHEKDRITKAAKKATPSVPSVKKSR